MNWTASVPCRGLSFLWVCVTRWLGQGPWWRTPEPTTPREELKPFVFVASVPQTLGWEGCRWARAQLPVVEEDTPCLLLRK